MKMSYRKGQGAEMMGLLVIVILLVVLFGLFISFKSSSNDTLLTSNLFNIRAHDLLNTMFNLYTPCKGVGMVDVLKKYFSGDAMVCGKRSSKVFKESVEGILNASFSKEFERGSVQFKAYKVLGEDSEELKDLEVVPKAGFKCSGRKIVSNIKIYNLEIGSLKFVIELCTAPSTGK